MHVRPLRSYRDMSAEKDDERRWTRRLVEDKLSVVRGIKVYT